MFETESPDMDIDRIAVTTLKWYNGVLNYYSARDVLELDRTGALTDQQLKPFIGSISSN